MAQPSFYELTGTPLENWLANFFSKGLEFSDYYKSPGQIALNILNPAIEPGHHLEIDGVLLIHKTCLLLECTNQQGGFRDKIKKFIRNCHLFVNDEHLSLREKFALFGIPQHKLDDFEEIENWKFVYFGTHPDFDLKNYGGNDFPDHPLIARHLFIFRPSQLEYLRQLTNAIGKFARNELLALLYFNPTDLGDVDESFSMDFIKADGKFVSSESTLKADVYLLKFKVNHLLEIAKVSRFEGLPFIMEDPNGQKNYQRMLLEEKLGNIAAKFIGGNKKKTFPNTITLSLSGDCEEAGGKLRIPKKYSSIDIIDGQHRLFSYTNSDVSDDVRAHAEILATAIKFRATTTNADLVTKSAARVFCEINSTQAKVSKDLLYLIKYEVLGDRDYPAAAGKILLDCDKRSGALNGLFAVNTLRRNNKLNKTPVNIIQLIESEIVPFLKGEGLYQVKVNPGNFDMLFDNLKYEDNPSEFLNKAVGIIEQYYNLVKSTFPKDWVINADTVLVSENYIIALMRFFRFQLYNELKPLADIRQILFNVKGGIDLLTGANNSPSFPIESVVIPSSDDTVDSIFSFLLGAQ